MSDSKEELDEVMANRFWAVVEEKSELTKLNDDQLANEILSAVYPNLPLASRETHIIEEVIRRLKGI